ncbi:DNA-packaging protein [Sphingosinicella humi]|uniref:ATP-binding protein n=1 Tax=Allosphingosinicella humi TaxID=2068657 RepID=A0A2U2IZD1_9SPHN|nr:terminase family protein [Sphingosinicella humi]PWG01440.1 ATP-binding protein [Sphingosinicella humi]
MTDYADFGDLLLLAGKMAAGDVETWERFVKGLSEPVKRRIGEEFFAWQAHGGQGEPPGDGWRVWLLMAGRGFGKTRAGAEWISARARENPGAAIALVGGSRDEVVKVMIEGPSGLIAVARTGEAPRWRPTRGVLSFSSGAEAFVYSAAAPEKLRGPEHHFAWADELAKWRQADAAWDNLMMGMRLGERPRMVVTTTPRSVAILHRVRALKDTVETCGRTEENAHLSGAVRAWLAETYGGTRLGRQELDGVLFDTPKGALWTRAMIERSRQSGTLPRGELRRVVVGVDPPVSAEGDACGIVVCGLGRDDSVYVLADCSVSGMRPEGWARAVARAAEAWGADRVVAEKNQGGDMVESVLRQVDGALPVKLVSASRGKAARAEPVATRFEGGRAKLAGCFPELEDELAGLIQAGGYEGPGRSPDRADAMVWAMTELMRPAVEPRIRVF